MSQECFVIQPFDAGKYDKRFKEIFSPAIVTAGFKPYRVDQDPSASIPIEEIERKIRSSSTCLADITTDNPNVWCELGMAIAFQKDICIVCSNERVGKYPFDVQHRNIIRYSGDSPGDFKKLELDIVQRLQAIAKNLKNVVELAPTNLVATKGLATHQIACLGMVASVRTGIAFSYLEDLMEKAGYSALATNLATRQLENIGLLNSKEFFDGGDQYDGAELTQTGWQWIEDNILLFDLTKSIKAKTISFARDLDDADPF